LRLQERLAYLQDISKIPIEERRRMEQLEKENVLLKERYKIVFMKLMEYLYRRGRLPLLPPDALYQFGQEAQNFGIDLGLTQTDSQNIVGYTADGKKISATEDVWKYIHKLERIDDNLVKQNANIEAALEQVNNYFEVAKDKFEEQVHKNKKLQQQIRELQSQIQD